MTAGKEKRCRFAAAALVVLFVLLAQDALAGEVFDEATLHFASRLDLRRWERLAVQDAVGVLRPLDSLARRRLRISFGRCNIDGASPTFAFLEMYFNTAAYPGNPVIKVGGDELRLIPLAAGTSIYLAPVELTGRKDGQRRWPGLTEEEADELHRRFVALAWAWRRRDVERTNALLGELHDTLTRRGAGRLPTWRAELELLHNRLCGFTIVWCGYAVAVALLLATGTNRRPRRRLLQAGMAVFVLSTVLLAVGVGARWIISGRGWRLPPLTNQFESVLAAALLGSVAACVLERRYKKGAFALAASVFATATLLIAFFQPGPLRADIDPVPGILHSPIHTWHVVIMLTGYALIGMSLVVSVMYLSVTSVRAASGTLGASLRSGGADLAGSVPAGVPAELDRCNLILIQLAFLLVAVGTALGACWADRALGRWWGWEPKETCTLMTLLVYLAILHVRFILPDRTRGLWTAVLSMSGCGVMVFTWWSLHGHA